MKKQINSPFKVALAFLTATTGLSFPAHGETYRAYEYLDNKIIDRPDIRDLYHTNSIAVAPRFHEQASRISLKDGIDLIFFKEVGEWLNTANNPSSTTWNPIAPAASCEQHKNFNLSKVPKPRPLCLPAKAILKETFQARHFVRHCQETYQPEMFAQDIAEGELQESKMDHLPTLVQTVIKPLSYIPLADNLAPQPLLEKMRMLLTKIRMDELLRNVKEKKKLYDQAINILNSDHCFSQSDSDLKNLQYDLQNLKAEMTQAENYLLQLDSEGRKQATADRARIEASGKQRARLPYPNLSDADREFITMYLSGIYWRLRGGGILADPNGTQKTRIFYTWMPMKALAKLNGGEMMNSMGFYMFMRLLKGYAEFWDMGTDPGHDKYWDLNKMTERGSFQVKSAGKFLDSLGYDTSALRAGGLQMGACYLYPREANLTRLPYAGHTHSSLPVPGSPYVAALAGPTEWAEVCFGMAIGLGMARSILGGHN